MNRSTNRIWLGVGRAFNKNLVPQAGNPIEPKYAQIFSLPLLGAGRTSGAERAPSTHQIECVSVLQRTVISFDNQFVHSASFARSPFRSIYRVDRFILPFPPSQSHRCSSISSCTACDTLHCGVTRFCHFAFLRQECICFITWTFAISYYDVSCCFSVCAYLMWYELHVCNVFVLSIYTNDMRYVWYTSDNFMIFEDCNICAIACLSIGIAFFFALRQSTPLPRAKISSYIRSSRSRTLYIWH